LSAARSWAHSAVAVGQFTLRSTRAELSLDWRQYALPPVSDHWFSQPVRPAPAGSGLLGFALLRGSDGLRRILPLIAVFWCSGLSGAHYTLL
jgi:hypothetical protein